MEGSKKEVEDTVKADVSDAFEVLDSKLDGLRADFRKFKDWEEKTDKIVEDKVFEIKAVAYLNLVINAVLLFLVLGVLLKAMGF
ncbi:MAG: hypothetical protein QW343_02885 [Candidatus Norongarragalinales archaeon]